MIAPRRVASFVGLSLLLITSALAQVGNVVDEALPSKAKSQTVFVEQVVPATKKTIPPESILKVGDRNYKVIRELGHGGLGTVYEAIDETNNQSLALKIIKCSSEERANRYVSAFRIYQGISSERMLPISNAQKFYSEQEKAFFVSYTMATIPNYTTLSSRKVKDSFAWKKLNFETDRKSEIAQKWLIRAEFLLKEFHELAKALQESGIVHRDIKPGNLVLEAYEGSVDAATIESRRYRILLADPDLVIIKGDRGHIAGTEGFIPPNALTGKPNDGIRFQDRYALAASFYEVVFGISLIEEIKNLKPNAMRKRTPTLKSPEDLYLYFGGDLLSDTNLIDQLIAERFEFITKMICSNGPCNERVQNLMKDVSNYLRNGLVHYDRVEVPFVDRVKTISKKCATVGYQMYSSLMGRNLLRTSHGPQ